MREYKILCCNGLFPNISFDFSVLFLLMHLFKKDDKYLIFNYSRICKMSILLCFVVGAGTVAHIIPWRVYHRNRITPSCTYACRNIYRARIQNGGGDDHRKKCLEIHFLVLIKKMKKSHVHV